MLALAVGGGGRIEEVIMIFGGFNVCSLQATISPAPSRSSIHSPLLPAHSGPLTQRHDLGVLPPGEPRCSFLLTFCFLAELVSVSGE